MIWLYSNITNFSLAIIWVNYTGLDGDTHFNLLLEIKAVPFFTHGLTVRPRLLYCRRICVCLARTFKSQVRDIPNRLNDTNSKMVHKGP